MDIRVVVEVVLDIIGLSEPEIQEITKGQDLVEVYKEGYFCTKCPAFSAAPCDLSPAKKARTRIALGTLGESDKNNES